MRKGTAGYSMNELLKFGVAIAFAALLIFAIDRVIEEIYQQALTSAVDSSG